MVPLFTRDWKREPKRCDWESLKTPSNCCFAAVTIRVCAPDSSGSAFSSGLPTALERSACVELRLGLKCNLLVSQLLPLSFPSWVSPWLGLASARRHVGEMILHLFGFLSVFLLPVNRRTQKKPHTPPLKQLHARHLVAEASSTILNRHQWILPGQQPTTRCFPQTGFAVCFDIYRNPGLSFQSRRPFAAFTFYLTSEGKKAEESG